MHRYLELTAKDKTNAGDHITATFFLLRIRGYNKAAGNTYKTGNCEIYNKILIEHVSGYFSR